MEPPKIFSENLQITFSLPSVCPYINNRKENNRKGNICIGQSLNAMIAAAKQERENFSENLQITFSLPSVCPYINNRKENNRKGDICMGQSLDAMIAAAKQERTGNMHAVPAMHVLPPVPRHKRTPKKGTRVEISTRLEDHDRAIIDALCARCNMSRAAMIVALHRCSTARFNRRLNKIDCAIEEIKARRS